MAQQDPTLMNATPSKKALLDSINTQIKAQTANKYGYSPYQSVGSLPAQEQDAILGDIANQITLQGKLTIGKGDLKQLPVFNAPTISARKPSFLEGLADIGANLGEGILQGATGRATDYYGNDLHDTFGIAGNPNNQWVRNITAIPTGLAVGAGLTLANPLLGAGWFGATSANQAVEGNQQAELGALAEGNIAQAQQLKGLRGVSAGLAGLAGGATSFLPATLGRGLLNKTLTGAGLGYTQDAINEKALEYATTGTATAGLPSVGLGTVFGAGFPLAGAGLKKLAGKRAKITEAQSQKQAVEALQNEADNAPLPSQRNRARATLRRINTELPVQQPISTRKPFKTAIETPQAKPVAQKPVAVVPVKKKIKPPFQLPTKVVGGFKKKVVNPAEVPQNIPDNVPVSAEVAKPAVVDVSKTETTTGKKTRTDVLKASLERKEAKLNDLFENQFSHWKKTNGQPMNDKRNGASHFKKSDKNDDAIRSQLAEIEKTKKAIEKEAVKVEQSERVKNSLPSSIVELLDSGKITQWRKFPDTFFVKGVDKGRFQYKDGVLSNRYYRDIPTQEQKAIFKDLYNSLNGKIEQSKTEAPTTKEGLATKPNSAKTAPVETTPAPKGKKGKLEPIKPNVVETRPKALKLNHDGVDFWVQKKWMRADGTLTASGVKSFEEARAKKQFFDSPEGKQAIENKQKRIDGTIQWALDKTLEDPSKNGMFKTSGASKVGETLAKLAESKGDFSFENMRKHHYLTGETATHTWELEHSKGYNPDASYDDVGSVTLRFKEKPPDTKVEPIPVKAKNHPPEVEGLKNGDKAPPMKEGESFDDYRARLEKQLPDGWGLRKASLDAGVVSLYEKTSKKRASAEGQADIEKVIGRPLDEASQDDLLKASKHFMEKATTDESPAITKANELIKKKANDAILEADARGEDTSVLRQAEANAIAGLDTLTEKGQIISVKDAPTEYELAIKRLKQDGNIDVAKVKAEADAVIKAIEDVEIPVKAINKGTRDIGTQLQDLKASQGTQVYTPDDIRRGVDVIGSHDSFLAQDTLEALGYPLKFSKNRKDPNSSGWSTVIGGKKIELYPGDSLGGLLRRNKISLNTLEKGLINKKYGDVVKRLVDDLDPNDLTLNETEARQKLTDYYDNLPKDGGLLTSREAEAFSLLDNAKTPEELNAVERYVSENENDYQDGFHEEFYSQWNEKHKALEDGYKAGIENRVAKADETRQLKATEELKVLRKQLETETNKVLKLEKELALISPAVRLERKLQTDVLKDARKVAKRLKGGYESGKIDDAEFTRIVEGLSPEAREALAEEFSC